MSPETRNWSFETQKWSQDDGKWSSEGQGPEGASRDLAVDGGPVGPIYEKTSVDLSSVESIVKWSQSVQYRSSSMIK